MGLEHQKGKAVFRQSWGQTYLSWDFQKGQEKIWLAHISRDNKGATTDNKNMNIKKTPFLDSSFKDKEVQRLANRSVRKLNLQSPIKMSEAKEARRKQELSRQAEQLRKMQSE